MALHGMFEVWLGGSGLQVQLRVEGKQLEIIERREARLQRVSSTQLVASERKRAEQLEEYPSAISLSLSVPSLV